jgi:hypothetical protein
MKCVKKVGPEFAKSRILKPLRTPLPRALQRHPEGPNSGGEGDGC